MAAVARRLYVCLTCDVTFIADETDKQPCWCCGSLDDVKRKIEEADVSPHAWAAAVAAARANQEAQNALGDGT